MIKYFNEISNADLKLVGGKNCSLGEMYGHLTREGIKVPYGFAITTNAYWQFIYTNELKAPLITLLDSLDRKHFSNLKEVGEKIREKMMAGKIPGAIAREVVAAYKKLGAMYHDANVDVAVRSSATAEDLPFASFAGLHESFLNIRSEERLMDAVRLCYVSLFTDRAIKYREENNFNHMNIALSVGVQKMVRSDLASSGIVFTVEPETGFKDIVHISGCWGLGENIVQGNVNPDEFYVFKPAFREGKNAIVSKKLGTKTKTMIYADSSIEHGRPVKNIDTPEERRGLHVLTDEEVNQIAGWSLLVEKHYGKSMDLEWAKDGLTNEIFIVQARPETVHRDRQPQKITEYKLKEKGKLLASGNAVGSKITSGIARILTSPAESDKLKEGEILVTDITNPDWDVILKKASAIVTNKGGRTSHASIVARELGAVAVVGAGNATEKISDGQLVTVSCAEGKTGNIYDGKLEWVVNEIDLREIKMPRTAPMMILGDPDKAFKLSFYPNKGIGLMRIEFIINNSIRIHPMALVKFHELQDAKAKQDIEALTHSYTDKKNYFVDKLAQSVATIACAFYPKDVIVRMSDFKTNEYANLIGGQEFEPKEENPMIGFRGASRYYNERYKEGFRLECLAMKKVREEMGLTNVKLMIPFCRTIDEGKKVVRQMEDNGLRRRENGLEIYVMVEIPSNVILADEFAEIFDGFSIGSNDLTQLTLGIDRDSSVISEIFSEQNAAVEGLIVRAIASAKKNKIKIGLCGQAPSDYPEFARFLVRNKIDSISFNPDALLKGIENINVAEEEIKLQHHPAGFVL